MLNHPLPHEFRPEAALMRLQRIVQNGATQVTSDFDLNDDASRITRANLSAAAVLIPFFEKRGELHVLLTKRKSDLRHHPGQIAFPGGKLDAEDDDATAAALREAEEEVGLPPRAVEVIGAIGAHRTVTGFDVTPILAHVPHDFDRVPAPGEVEQIFDVPLRFLMSHRNERVEGRRWQGDMRYYYVIPYGPFYIWGATARMIVALRELWHVS